MGTRLGRPLVPGPLTSHLQIARMGLDLLGLLQLVLLTSFRGHSPLLEHPFPRPPDASSLILLPPPCCPPQASQMALEVGGAFSCLHLTSLPSPSSATGCPQQRQEGLPSFCLCPFVPHKSYACLSPASSSSRVSLLLRCSNHCHGCHLMPPLATSRPCPPLLRKWPRSPESFSTPLSVTPHPIHQPILCWSSAF